MKERKLIDAVINTYNQLCSNFMEICRTQPTKKPNEIPGAMEALAAVNEFEEFVKKYFNLVYNPRTHSWEEIE